MKTLLTNFKNLTIYQLQKELKTKTGLQLTKEYGIDIYDYDTYEDLINDEESTGFLPLEPAQIQILHLDFQNGEIAGDHASKNEKNLKEFEKRISNILDKHQEAKDYISCYDGDLGGRKVIEKLYYDTLESNPLGLLIADTLVDTLNIRNKLYDYR